MFHERSTKYKSSDTMWCSKVNKIIENNFNNGQQYEVLPSSDSIFYIKGGRSGEFKVDTINKTCSCLQFQQMQYPCIHAAAAISFSKQNLNDFDSGSYKSDKLIQLYAMSVEPILVSELDSQNVLPPIARRLPGRPKKVRIRNRNEGEESNITCSMCHQNGHNKRTCLRRSQSTFM